MVRRDRDEYPGYRGGLEAHSLEAAGVFNAMSNRKYMIALAAAASGGLGEVVRRRRAAAVASTPARPGGEVAADPPPPLTTQSSPGQIAELQQSYGAEMAPSEAPAPLRTDHS